MTARTDATALRLARAVEAVRVGLSELASLESTAPAEVAAFLAMVARYVDVWRGREVRP